MIGELDNYNDLSYIEKGITLIDAPKSNIAFVKLVSPILQGIVNEPRSLMS